MAVVSHYNIAPVIDIYGSVSGRDLGGVARDINARIDALRSQLPRGSQVVVRGQVQTMRSSYVGLLSGLVFAILLDYLLIVVNFQSWLDPLIMISALPAALAGIAWFLFITHTTLSVPALMGTIMCMGVATSNSILVVSFATEQMAAGKDSISAALEAGFTRFRPVLMTALAMIIGMVPMALGLGDGGEQNAPLGRAVIGGLLFATLSTLLFVPTFFSLLQGRIEKQGLPAGKLLDKDIWLIIWRKAKLINKSKTPEADSRNDAQRNGRFRRWLIPVIGRDSCSRRLVLRNPLTARGRSQPAFGDSPTGGTLRFCGSAQTCSAGSGDYSPREHTAVHFFADLCPHRWLLKEVVFRHRSACEGRATAGHNPDSRSR